LPEEGGHRQQEDLGVVGADQGPPPRRLCQAAAAALGIIVVCCQAAHRIGCTWLLLHLVLLLPLRLPSAGKLAPAQQRRLHAAAAAA
jgi:hypothetical protein